MAINVRNSCFGGMRLWAGIALCLSPACSRAQPGFSPPTLPVSVNELMVAWVDPSGHQLWDREQDGQAPKTESDWREIERHATQLAAAGTVIAPGGTGQRDREWATSPDWRKYSQDLTKAGLAARAAAQTRSFEALVQANGELVQVCENCHRAFKPEVPTEGKTHQPH